MAPCLVVHKSHHTTGGGPKPCYLHVERILDTHTTSWRWTTCSMPPSERTLPTNHPPRAQPTQRKLLRYMFCMTTPARPEVISTDHKCFGIRPQGRMHSDNPPASNRTTPSKRGLSDSPMTCFNFTCPTCRISTCPFANHQARIMRNVDKSGKWRGLSNPLSENHLTDLASPVIVDMQVQQLYPCETSLGEATPAHHPIQ